MMRVPHAITRLRGFRFGIEAWLALVLPLVVLGGLLVAQVAAEPAVEPEAVPPTEDRLPRATLVCPSAEGAPVSVGTDSGTTGSLRIGPPGEREGVELGGETVLGLDAGPEPLVVSAAGQLAPGLFAGRSTTAPATATDCLPTVGQQWFTAVGAGAEWSSTLELVNPNPGPAVADVAIFGHGGPVEVPGMRGLTVPGRGSLEVPLSDRVARRGQLMLRIDTTRGRLGISVRNRISEVGGGLDSEEWLPSETEPSAEPLMLGLVRGDGDRRLVVGNPGETEVRARLRLVTQDATLEPTGFEPIRVPPQSTVEVRVEDVLGAETAADALGVQLLSTGPVTAALRQVADGDLAYASPVPPITAATAAVVPPGTTELLLAGVQGSGSVEVAFHREDGSLVDARQVDLAEETAARVEVPADARRVSLALAEGSVVGASLVVDPARQDGVPGEGFAVVPLREVVRYSLVPEVGPGALR